MLIIGSQMFFHRAFADPCLVFSLIFFFSKKRPHPDTIEHIIREAVEIECEFLTDALPCSMIGMNEKLMCQYIRFVADRLLVALGNEKIYNDTNPFGEFWLVFLSSFYVETSDIMNTNYDYLSLARSQTSWK